MSAETLRRAAALMRERALAASNPPWTALTMFPTRSEVTNETEINGGVVVRTPSKDDFDVEHIAAWHPAVALAVADLLDNEASLIEGANSHPDLHMPLNGARIDLLTAVARTYLQETP